MGRPSALQKLTKYAAKFGKIKDQIPWVRCGKKSDRSVPSAQLALMDIVSRRVDLLREDMLAFWVRSEAEIRLPLNQARKLKLNYKSVLARPYVRWSEEVPSDKVGAAAISRVISEYLQQRHGIGPSAADPSDVLESVISQIAHEEAIKIVEMFEQA